MDIVKIGRTHLQDAVPLRLGDEVSAWRDQVRQGRNGSTRLDRTCWRSRLEAQPSAVG